MLISWIIPLYNCEQYVGRCIESLINQGIRKEDFEIIIVDDGSTDNSCAIVQSYQTLHSNIVIVKQDHEGVSKARNHGLEICKGEYVHFVDADDIIRQNAIGAIFKNIEKHDYTHHNIIGFTHRNFNDLTQISSCLPTETITFERYRLYDFCCTYGFRPNACDYLFKRELLMRNSLSFSTLSVGEDVMFMLNIYSLTDEVILYTPLPVYYYFQRIDSTSNRMDRKHLLKSFNHFCEIHVKVSQSIELQVYPQKILGQCTLAYAQCQAITALLAACLPLGYLRTCYDKAYKLNLFPIPTSGLVIRFLALLSKHPCIAYFMSYLYRYFYVPLIRNRRLSK